MALDHLFDWLVSIHYEQDLASHLRHLELGGAQIPEGEEIRAATGVLILGDGPVLASRLVDDRVILDRLPPRFSPVGGYQAFRNRVAGQGKQDGVLVYNGQTDGMAGVSKLANTSPAIDAARASIRSLLPPNFIFRDRTYMSDAEIDRYIGTRTDLALVLPVAYSTPESDVHAFMIKQTATTFGTGKVIHTSKQGLRDEFYFDDRDGQLVGIRASYDRHRGRVHLIDERVQCVPASYQQTFDRIMAKREELQRNDPSQRLAA